MGPSAPLYRRPEVAAGVLLFWTAIAAIAAGAIYFDGTSHMERPAWGRIFAEQVAMFWLWALVTLALLRRLERRPLRRTRLFRDLATLAGWSLLWFALYAPATVLVILVSRGIPWRDYPRLASGMASFHYYVDYLIFWMVVAATQAIVGFRALLLEAEERRRLEGQLAEAKLRLLAAQLEPHFLYNSLNSAASLVRLGEPERAIEALERLTQLLRYAVEVPDRTLVTLLREVEFARDYLELQSLRFGDRLTWSLDAPDTGQVEVPLLSLQPLLENAVLHGALAGGETCRIAVKAAREGDRATITVENTLGSAGETRGLGQGLAALEARLTAAFGGAARLEAGPSGNLFRATLTVPVGGWP